MKPAYQSAPGVPFRNYGAPHQTRPRAVTRRDRIKARARWLQADYGLERDDQASGVAALADDDTVRAIRSAGAAAAAGAVAASGRFS